MSALERLWSLRPHVYRLLNRRGGRTLLARAGTWAARRESDEDVEIFWGDPLWMYRFGEHYLPGLREFRFAHPADLGGTWKNVWTNAVDAWFAPYEPKPGDVIVDGGAGIGWNLPLFQDAVGERGRVLAIEANPKTFERLEATVRWNRYPNVIACHAALTGSPGPVYVQDRPPETYTRSTVSQERRSGDLNTPVEGTTLDELCARFDITEIALLKLNIEGSEGAAIDGMTKMIARTHAVVVACHDFDGIPTRERVSEFLASNGFEVWRRDDERDFMADHVYGLRKNGGR
jgi:FkbM family methyltransferase